MAGHQPPSGAAVEVAASELPALCERLRPQLRAILKRCRIPPEDSEDLLQTTLRIAIEKWREIESPEPWLLATLRRHCALHWREHRRRTARQVPLEPLGDEPGEAAGPLLPPTPPEQERRDALLDLRRLAHDLPPHQRRLLALRHHLGLSTHQTAAVASYANSSVNKVTRRAVANLRRAQERAEAAASAWAAALAAAPARPIPWHTAAAAFAATRRGRGTAGHLAAAGAHLGAPALGALTVERLGALRTRARRRGQTAMLAAVRRFLEWASDLGAHRLPRAHLAEALGAAAGTPRKAPGPHPPRAAAALAAVPTTPMSWDEAVSAHLAAQPHHLPSLRPNAVRQALRPPDDPPPPAAHGAASLGRGPGQEPVAAAATSAAAACLTTTGAGTVLAGIALALTRFLAHVHQALHSPAAAGAPAAPEAGPDAEGGGPAPGPAAAVPVALAWDEAVDRFLATAGYGRSTRASYRRALRQAGKHLGALPLASLRRELLAAFRAHLAATGAANVPVILAALRSFLRWCGDQGLHGLGARDIRLGLQPPAARG